jgi:DNA-binding NarL/FixJ family response regulator
MPDGEPLAFRYTPPVKSSSEAKPPVHAIFLVDDHPIFREGLRELLEGEDDLMVCGEAGGPQEAVEKLKKLRPDLAIIDVALAGTNGIDLVIKLRRQHASLAILVLSMHEGSDVSARAFQAGAGGYLTKHAPAHELLQTIRTVCRTPVPALREGAVSPRPASSPMLSPRVIESLSTRELEITRLIADGLTTRAIAEKIGISGKTVETHRGNIRHKLQLRTGQDLVGFAESTFGKSKVGELVSGSR